MSTGIIGYGVVGQATHHMLKDKDDVIILDPNVSGCHGDFTTLLKCKAIFICLNIANGTDSQDYLDLTRYLNGLSSYKYSGVIAIRSTVLPNCEPVVKFKQDLKIVAFPEFLTEITSFDDEFTNIILGGAYRFCKTVVDVLRDEYSPHFTSFNDAMAFKYVRNLYGAYKVLFWEFVQETTGKSRKMAELMKYFPSGNYAQVGMDGFRGFGGKCFPKDTLAFHNVTKHMLTKFMLEYNKSLREKIPEETGCFG